MKTLKAAEEFVVGKNNIKWINSNFTNHFKDTEFELKEAPIFQKLPSIMNDASIENELKPGLCELGDILAFIQNPPEESKDGYSNLFYTPAFVISVFWDAGHGEWFVYAWQRDDLVWRAGGRVFSPATVNFGAKTLALESLDTRVTKIEKVLEIKNNAAAEKLIAEIQQKLEELKKLI